MSKMRHIAGHFNGTVTKAMIAQLLLVALTAAQQSVPRTTDDPRTQSDHGAQSGSHTWRRSFRSYARVEGQPIESRPPEKSDDAPLFPQQTRAPFHATAPYKINTLVST